MVPKGTRGGGTPLEIAKRRYTAGEITREEFERTRRGLR
ncbi:MAG: SHOCT domain-containing protein [Actinomycetota bacterium]